MRSGRYSKLKHLRLKELITQFEQDPAPLNIMPELILARAVLTDFMERYDRYTEALLAWHESYVGRPVTPDLVAALARVVDGYEASRPDADREALAKARACVERLATNPETRPRQLLDLSDVYRLVSEVTKIWERIQRANHTGTLGRFELFNLMTEMGNTVARHVTDDATQTAIAREWEAIVVSTASPSHLRK